MIILTEIYFQNKTFGQYGVTILTSVSNKGFRANFVSPQMGAITVKTALLTQARSTSTKKRKIGFRKDENPSKQGFGGIG